MRLQWHNGQHHWQCGFILWIIIMTCTSWFPIEWYGGLKQQGRLSLCWCFPHLSAPTAVPGTGSGLCQQSTLVKWRCDTCLGIARRFPSGCILHLHPKLDNRRLKKHLVWQATLSAASSRWWTHTLASMTQKALQHLDPLCLVSTAHGAAWSVKV